MYRNFYIIAKGILFCLFTIGLLHAQEFQLQTASSPIMRLFFVNQEKSLSEIPPEGYSGYNQKIDSANPVAEWGPYILQSDMEGSNYDLNIWALSPLVNGVQTTTDFRVEVLVNNNVVATFDFTAKKYSISSGLWFSTTGTDPATTAGDEVKVRISYRGGYGGSVSWGFGGVGATYVQIPAAPYNVKRIGEFFPGSNTYAIAVVDQFIYLGSDKNFVILDAFNPIALTIVGSLPYPAQDIAISGNYAYLVYSKNLYIIDVAYPSNPKLVGNYNMLSNGLGVTTNGDYAYIADADVGLKIINIKNPSTPTLVGNCDTPGSANEVVVSGDYAYLTCQNNGLQIINISNSANPALIGSYDTPYPGSTDDLVVSGNYAYLADWAGSLKIVNVSNPSAPTLTGTFKTPSYAEEIAAFDNYIALAQFEGMLDFIDYSNPNNLKLVGRNYGGNYPEDVDFKGKRAYVLEDFGKYLRIYQFQPRGPEPIIIASHRYLDFGTVYINNLKSLTFTVANLVAADLSINNINRSNISSEFNLITPTDFPITLKPGDLPLSVTISFSPSSTGEKVDTLNIISNDPESPNIHIVLKGLSKMPLSAPTLAYPPDGSTGIPINPTLSWNVSSGAASYRLQVATDLAFSTTVFDDSTITTTSKQVGPLTNNMTYYWRVRAKDAGGMSDWSTIWNFTTTIAPPNAPVLLSPANNAANQPTSLKLSWNPSLGAVSYRLQVSKNYNFTEIMLDDSTITNASYLLGSLENDKRYYWRVNAKNNVGGVSGWSQVWNFKTVTAPLAPILKWPTNGSVNMGRILRLEWNKSTGAISYRLQISTSALFDIIVYDDSTITLTSKVPTQLANNTTYYWRVNAKNNLGGTSSWSDIWHFTTIAAPLPPRLLSPLNHAIDLATNLLFTWNASYSAQWYTLHIAVDSLFSALAINNSVTDTLYSVTALSNNTKYYWRVNASHLDGISDWSNIWNFTTVIDTPSIPILKSPSNGSINQPTTLSLSWNPSANATTYRLQISTNSDFAETIFDDSTIASTSKQINSLANNITYYWRVNAKNIGGTSAWSSVWNFTTIIAAPLAPTLSSPSSGATNQPTTLILTWNLSSGASSYHLQVSTNAGFATTVIDDSTITNTSKEVGSLANDTTYYWRVRARNIGGISAWSNIWNFITIVAAPLAPTLASPSNGAENQPTILTLNWNSATGVKTYHLQISTSANFTTIIIDDSTMTTIARQIGPLPNNATYYWRVNAKNIGGTSAYSEIWNFTTIVELPNQVLLISPINSEIIGVDSVRFIWLKSKPKVARYWFEFATDSLLANPVIDTLLTDKDTTKIVHQLVDKQTYWWKVRAKNAAGWGPFSEEGKFYIDIKTSVRIAEDIPREFSLSQNYPNPFNPETNIAYQIPKSSPVIITVFNLLGNEIRTLVDEQKPVGKFIIQWDGKDHLGRPVSSGIYIYRIQAGHFVDMKKMILMR